VSEQDDRERRARERLGWKDSGLAALSGPRVSREEELDDAAAILHGTLPVLIDRERARRDDFLRLQAQVVGDALAGGTLRDVAGPLKGAALERFAELEVTAKYHDDNVRRLEEIAAEKRATLNVSVKSEPRVYGPGSPNSYYRDIFSSSLPGLPDHYGAVERLQQYGRELGIEAMAGSPEGRRAQRVAETRGRERQGGPEAAREEWRAMSSGSTSGGAFVTPAYLEDAFGSFNPYPPSFYAQAQQCEDPGYGMEILVPLFTSGGTVAEQLSDNSGIQDTSPTTTYVTANLAMMAGEIEVSQQFFDRAGPLAGDTVIDAQLRLDLLAQLDAYCLGVALGVAGTVSDSTSFSVAELWGDLAKAKSQMLTTAGTLLPATAMFMQPTWYEWAESQVDPNGRPLLLPQPAGTSLPLVPGRNGTAPPGYTGEKLLAVPTFTDGNIPNSGANTQMVVANMGEVFQLTSEPTARAVPETLAEDMTVVIQLYCLVGCLVRHSPAVQVVTGSAYPAAPSFS
jgi:hypothetical protein